MGASRWWHGPVINVTNTRGDGTLAHEWRHALKFHLRGKPGKQAIREITQALRRRILAAIRAFRYALGF